MLCLIIFDLTIELCWWVARFPVALFSFEMTIFFSLALLGRGSGFLGSAGVFVPFWF